MPLISAIFLDIGGVILTNAWDGAARRATASGFDLDYETFSKRHSVVEQEFETGRLTRDAYLSHTVFYRHRGFSRAEFVAAMQSHSNQLRGGSALLSDIARGGVFAAAVNNESRELNDYRIRAFGLARYLSLFVSSCYVGVRKPERRMFELALELTHRRPEECLFIDDDPANVQSAAAVGLRSAVCRGPVEARDYLVSQGIVGNRP